MVELKPPPVAPEQLCYARWLGVGARAAIVLMAVAFFVYYVGLVPGVVPLEQLPALWSLPAAEFLARTGMPAGWGWVALLGHGDVINVAVLAALAGLSVPCLLSLVPFYRARGERVYLVIVLLAVAVICAAATGWISAGH